MLRVIQGVFLIINLLLSESKSQTIPSQLGCFHLLHIFKNFDNVICYPHLFANKVFLFRKYSQTFFYHQSSFPNIKVYFSDRLRISTNPKNDEKLRSKAKENHIKNTETIFFLLSNKSNFLLDWLGISNSK